MDLSSQIQWYNLHLPSDIPPLGATAFDAKEALPVGSTSFVCMFMNTSHSATTLSLTSLNTYLWHGIFDVLP